ncbi:MAG: hypothetical protein OXH39_03615 [Candidatus Poribacteria bacterium]|nr:hypothetical protein [Candidatus Poribacteria bacterium]
MIWTPQAYFTTLHRPINQEDSETQRKPTAMFPALDVKNVGFRYALSNLSSG